jgi:hypothetical protein
LGKIVKLNPKSNQSSPTMSSEIHPNNIAMATLEEVPKDPCKAFEDEGSEKATRGGRGEWEPIKIS